MLRSLRAKRLINGKIAIVNMLGMMFTPVEQQHQRPQRHLEQGHRIGQPRRVFHLLKRHKQAAQGICIVGKKHRRRQQQQRLDLLRMDRL